MTAYVYNEDGDKLGEAALEYQNILQTSTNVSPVENSSAPIDAGMYQAAIYDNAESSSGYHKSSCGGMWTVGNAGTYGQKLNLNKCDYSDKKKSERFIQDTIACADDKTIGSSCYYSNCSESVSRNYLRTIKVNNKHIQLFQKKLQLQRILVKHSTAIHFRSLLIKYPESDKDKRHFRL